MLGYFVPLYVAVGIAATAFAVNKTDPGPWRVFVFATVFSVFFSLGLAVGHGVMPYPALLLLGRCVFDSCGQSYGSLSTLLLFVLLPAVVQWLLMLAISFGIYRLAMRRQPQADGDATAVAGAVHKPIIGAIWLTIGIGVILVLAYFVFFALGWDEVGIDIHLQLGAYMLLGVLQVLTGLALLLDVAWSRWLSIPLSILALPVFPLGTALGGYYFWYYLNFEHGQR